MRSNRKHSTEELLMFMNLYLHQGVSFSDLQNKHQLLLSQSTFRSYLARYQVHGVQGLESSRRNRHYSAQFKDKVVRLYLEEDYSYSQLAVQFNIPDIYPIRQWVKRVTEGKGMTSGQSKAEVYTMKGRTTTLEERIKIAKAVIFKEVFIKQRRLNIKCLTSKFIHGSTSINKKGRKD